MKRLGIILVGMATLATLAMLTSGVPESEQATKAPTLMVVDPAAEPASSITMVDEGEVASDALWLTRYRFGPGLNANRNSIQVYKGYIFVSWYQGGMDNRTVILSRKKIGSKEWSHISFPHRHVMFRGDKDLPENERRGDSHNTIAIGICPKDDTVHLIYDLHAYQPRDFKDDYFNYSVSKKGGAIVQDAQWALNIFSPKRNHLNPKAPKSTYYRITYPSFRVGDNGNLSVGWRQGGTHDAEMQFSTYDGEKWTSPMSWNKPNKENTKGFYGDFKEFNGKMYACWARRSPGDVKAGFLASGLYLGGCNDPNGATAWYTMSGEKSELPLQDWEAFKIAEPVKSGERIGGGPNFIITKSGAFHGLYSKIGIKDKPSLTRHFYRASAKEPLSMYENNGVIEGSLREIDDQLYLFGLEDGRPHVKVFDGVHQRWNSVYVATGTRYRQCVITWDGDTCYYHLIENPDSKEDDRVPMRVVSISGVGKKR